MGKLWLAARLIALTVYVPSISKRAKGNIRSQPETDVSGSENIRGLVFLSVCRVFSGGFRFVYPFLLFFIKLNWVDGITRRNPSQLNR